VSRPRTNTPLQALVTLNDPVFVEAARVMAERVIREGGATPDERIAYAFRLAVARRPTARERDVVQRLYVSRLERYRGDRDGAEALASSGKAPREPGLDAAEVAAWTTVSQVLLNLDETITRE
jgi:hypothetical protein